MTMPSKVRIYEVGPRDGLQAEKQSVSTEEKIELQGKYIEDLKKNKDKIIREKLSKIDNNQDIIDDKVKDRETFKTENEMLLQDISDRIEVLRLGKIAGSFKTNETTGIQIVNTMVGGNENTNLSG